MSSTPFTDTDPVSQVDAQAAAVAAAIKVMHNFQAEINTAYLARYFCLIGFVVLVYDNISSFSTEKRLVWSARPSFTKYGFLVNRYLVPVCMFVAFLPLSGFVGMEFSNSACQGLMSVTAMLAVTSLALGNGLVMIRVVDLWDHNKMVVRTMFGGFIIAYGITIVSFIAAVLNLLKHIEFNPLLNMCVLRKASMWLIPPWAAPLVFELLVLGATCWNAIDRPRSGDMPLRHVLHRDGITFFLVMAILRAANLGIVATQKPSFVMLGVYIVWALVTVALNRSLLAFAKAEFDEAVRAPSRSGRRSPFGIRVDEDLESDMKPHQWEAGVPVEVGRVEIELSH